MHDTRYLVGFVIRSSLELEIYNGFRSHFYPLDEPNDIELHSGR